MQTVRRISFDIARFLLVSFEITPPSPACTINNGFTDAWSYGEGHRAFRIGRLLIELANEPVGATLARWLHFPLGVHHYRREVAHG